MKQILYTRENNTFLINISNKLENELKKTVNYKNFIIDSKNENYLSLLKINQINKTYINNYISKNKRVNIEDKFGFEELNIKPKTQKNNIILKDIESIFDFNENLKKINHLKFKNLELSNFDYENKSFSYKNITKKLNNKKYYSNLFSCINFNLKEKCKKSTKPKDKKLFEINFKRQRYLKNKDEIKYLEDFFKTNEYKWDNCLVKELSEKLSLSKNSIYKWNWDKMRKK